MTEQEQDKHLVQRAQRGDKRAFDLLVLRYQGKILNVINRYMRNPDESMDVAQEAFIKAYRALPRFRGDSAFYTWLYRIAINTAKNALVSRSRRPPGSDLDPQDAEQFDGATGLQDIETPERQALTDEIAQTVHEAMADLPEDLRIAISLRELDGMSYEEIAQTMECPIGTVRSRIFRARDAISKRLDPLLT